MTNIVYYVAATLDGFICGADGGISAFVHDDEFVEHYKKSLQRFHCTIMGKTTYEFGYAYGLQPGQKAYPHMDHYVFSKSIQLPDNSEVVAVRANWAAKLQELKNTARFDIYLCGGSEFAGFVLEAGLINELIVKVNPVLLGEGKPLFSSSKPIKLSLKKSLTFSCGIIESHYLIS